MYDVPANLRDATDAQTHLQQWRAPNPLERQGVDLLMSTRLGINPFPPQNDGVLDFTAGSVTLAGMRTGPRENPGASAGQLTAGRGIADRGTASRGTEASFDRTDVAVADRTINMATFRTGVVVGDRTTGGAAARSESETMSDGSTVRRENGLIASIDQGNKHVEFQYQKDLDGSVKRDDKGNPVLAGAVFTENGRTQTIDLQSIARNSDNTGRDQFMKQFGMDAAAAPGTPGALDHFSLEQSGNNAGKISAITDDGSKAIYGMATKPDGTLCVRVERQEKASGLVRDFEYKNANDPMQVSAFTDTFKSTYGKDIVERSERIGDSGRFIMKDGDGRISYAKDVHVDAGGDIVYRQDNPSTNLMETIFGPAWLRRGDLTAAKQHVLDVASSHYQGGRAALEHDLDAMQTRMQSQTKIKLPKITDDQIGSIYRSLASIYDKGHCSAISNAEADKGFARAVASLRNPYDNNMQGQIGSCYLNSILMVAEFGHPEMVANAWATAYTTGKYKGKTFNHYDLTGTANQDSFNHTMTSFLGKTFGFAHMTPGFRGTCEDEARKAYKALTGKNFKVANHMSATERDKAIERDGGVVWYTMGGGHAQCGTHDWRKDGSSKNIVEVRENTWFLHDGKVLRKVKTGLDA